MKRGSLAVCGAVKMAGLLKGRGLLSPRPGADSFGNDSSRCSSGNHTVTHTVTHSVTGARSSILVTVVGALCSPCYQREGG